VFVPGGERYQLTATDGPDHLHGGVRSWDKQVWRGTASETPQGPNVTFEYVSADGEEGYPGRVSASTSYTLTQDGAVDVEMRARTERTTIVGMAHHTYWNLGGAGASTALDHELSLNADFYTPGDPVVPTGRLERVANTPFDFRGPKLLGKDLEQLGNDPVGYDHNFIVNGVPGALRPVARLRHPASGRKLALEADAPGVQLYTANFLKGDLVGKGGKVYPKHGAVCLESQAFPNSINVPEWEGQVILSPAEEYRHVMIHRFSAD
jgi:aldose 1-epimerase